MLKKRNFVRLLIFSLLLGLLAAVPLGAQDMMTYQEAPMLAEKVAAGELPPVEGRLPENPLVVEPVESVGEYGGVWRRAFRGIADFHAYGRTVYDPVLRWPRDPKDPVQPGLAERWEWNADSTELTLYFRKGLKWSDGEPWTVDDVIFWWEAIETDTNITPAIHGEWVVNGQPMELEKIDDSTIKLKFAGPNGLALTVGLAFHGHQWPLAFERFGFFAPKHYLEQFHPAYSETGDYQVFEEKANDFNVERPVMWAWKISQWEPGATEMITERNPYYWKVDPEGNQLPYIDGQHFALVEDNAAINVLAIAGEIDMQTRGLELANYPVFQENAEAGDYHMLLWPAASAAQTALFFNQSYGDLQYREMFQQLEFRQAMSVAIDRDTINQVAFLGQGVPRTSTVVPDSPYYDPELEAINAEYDPDKASALLDGLGLERGGDGFRTFADSTPIELVVETSETAGPRLDALELVAENWNAVGMKTEVRPSTRDIYWPKAGANEVMIATWGLDRGLVAMVDPVYQFPFDERSWMAPSFGTWYKTGGELGEEPSDLFKQAMALYDEYKITVDETRQVEIGTELVRMSTENMWTIGLVGLVPGPVVVKNNFKNVMTNHTADWIIMTPGTMDPAHFYFDN
ncbi:MAG: ABC transporter substrate-binding protein [Anaerolineae bacterium]|nr:ABC transporter substrate-binding protein [Anaerolineae bacterium]